MSISAPTLMAAAVPEAKEAIVRLAEGFAALITSGLDWLLGTRAERLHSAIYGRVTWADVCASAVILSLVLIVHGVVMWFLHRQHHPPGQDTKPTDWRALIAKATGKPVYLLLWITGAYFAATPLLAHLSDRPDQMHPLQYLFDVGFNVGFFVVVIWLFVRFMQVAEVRANIWTKKTPGTLDDLFVPVFIKSLSVVVSAVAIISALPLLGLPDRFANVLGKVTSMLIIGTVAWILCQVVALLEKLVLSRYDITAADNLHARQIYTQIRVLRRTLLFVIGIFTAASVLMLFDQVRHFGASILASAGVAGIILGFAAQKTIANLFAGVQIAVTQPIRLDDVVVVENEFGNIEEISLTYVVIRVWDLRRLVVPISYFIEKPFQNWTRASADILGTVMLYCDYTVPVDEVRQELERIVKNSPKWDRKVLGLQVTNTTERTVELRALVSASDAGKCWDLRCEIREQLIAFLQKHHPESLPRRRTVAEPPNWSPAKHAPPIDLPGPPVAAGQETVSEPTHKENP